MRLKVGDEILMMDARGCTKVHRIVANDTICDTEFYLNGVVWSRLAFRVTDRRDASNRVVVKSAHPAVGPAGTAFDAKLHLPEGWSAPGVRS